MVIDCGCVTNNCRRRSVSQYRRLIKSISVQGNLATFDVIRRELSARLRWITRNAGCSRMIETTLR